MCLSARLSCGRSVQLGHMYVLLVSLAAAVGHKHSPRRNIPCKDL